MEKLVEKRNRIEVETKVAKKELAQVKEEERLEQEKGPLMDTTSSMNSLRKGV